MLSGTKSCRCAGLRANTSTQHHGQGNIRESALKFGSSSNCPAVLDSYLLGASVADNVDLPTLPSRSTQIWSTRSTCSRWQCVEAVAAHQYQLAQRIQARCASARRPPAAADSRRRAVAAAVVLARGWGRLVSVCGGAAVQHVPPPPSSPRLAAASSSHVPARGTAARAVLPT